MHNFRGTRGTKRHDDSMTLVHNLFYDRITRSELNLVEKNGEGIDKRGLLFTPKVEVFGTSQ